MKLTRILGAALAGALALGGLATSPAHAAPVDSGDGLVYSEFTGDSYADTLGITTSGDLLMYKTTVSTGDVPWVTLSNPVKVGQGWQSNRWVSPTLDLNGDGWGEMFAIRNDGTLWRYMGLGGGRFGTALKVGQGWDAKYDLMTLTWDSDDNGLPELVTRDKTTGTLYAYPMVDTQGRFGNRTQIGTGWGGITKLASLGPAPAEPGDALYGTTTSGAMYRYLLRNGKITSSKQVGSGWQSINLMYNAGDLNGDWYVDLVGRNTAGELWLYEMGDDGSLVATQRIGTGWNGLVKIF